MNLYPTTAILTSIIAFAMALLVYLKRPKSTINKAAGLFCFSVGWFSLFLTFLYLSRNKQQAIVYAKLLNAGGFFVPSTFLHFSLAFAGEHIKKRNLILSGYLLSFIFLSSLPTPLVIEGASEKLFGFYYPDAGLFYIFFVLMFFLFCGYSEYAIFKEHKKCKDHLKRNQFKYVLTATGIGFLCAATYIPLVLNMPIPPIGGHFIFACLCLIAYSIARHKLLDITIVIRKTLIYSTLIALITTIYMIGVLLTEKYFQTLFGYESLMITIVIASTIALFFIPIKNKVQHFVDKAFFKGTQEQIARENERLRQEIRRNEKLKAVATLAAGMAHEIKNPLTSIKTFTEYLPERYKDPAFREKFSKIVGNEVDRIDKIVHQLLDFAKPAPLELTEVNIHQILDETLELLSNNLVKKKIKLIREYHRSNPIIKADSNQLKQVFLNIFLNSLDYNVSGLLK